ncbi:hypothetical protein KH5_05480 [Urechidicola sp. KH5]
MNRFFTLIYFLVIVGCTDDSIESSIEDAIPPVITLIGFNPQIIDLGNNYQELGATALDNLDGDISERIIINSDAVNVNQVGSYEVFYKVQDASGNQTMEKRIVNIVDNDFIPHIEIDFTDSFQIGSDLGLNYLNDITVGVLSLDEDEIKLITASGNSSYLLTGTSISNISEAIEIASPIENSIYSDYIGMGQLIKDKNGTIYSVIHGEQQDGSILPGNIPGFYASIGLGISSDNGNSFSINEGPLIEDLYDISINNGFADGGLGEPSITFSQDSTEVFVYYVDHNRDGRGVNIAMSKFNVEGDGTPNFNECFYLNQDNEFTTELIRSKEVVIGMGNSDAIFPHVTFNKFSNKYLMVYSENNWGEFNSGVVSPSESGVYYRYSNDGINWEESPVQLLSGWSIPWSINHSYLWHPNLIYTNEMQSEGYLIYSKADSLQQGHKMYAVKFEIMRN